MRGRALVVGMLGLGCGGREPCELAAEVEPSLELGSGESSFTRLSDGQVMHQEYGPQGGSHLWVALRVEGLVPGQRRLFQDKDAPTVELTLTSTADDQVWGSAIMDWSAFRGDEAESELHGAQLMLSWGIEDVIEAPFTLWGQVEDVCGTLVDAEVDVEVK